MRKYNYQASYVSEMIDEEDDTDYLEGYEEVEFEIGLELYELGLDENKRKDTSEKGDKMTFKLLFAVLLSFTFMIITPFTAKQIDLITYWWAPLIAAFVGALIGAYVGSIFDAFNSNLPIKEKIDVHK
ncbi:MAG: hypothetical protein ACTSQ4_03005 [Candidatus Heimdallarchaeaceae archaeon]